MTRKFHNHTLQTNPRHREEEVKTITTKNIKHKMRFIMLINVKMPIIVDILVFMRMINTTSESIKTRKIFIFKRFRFYEHLKIHVQLS